MEYPYGEQYSQEGNPRAYMTMRDYRNLPYQWQNQQPVGRNPNPPRSMREYRDQWMSAPVYSVPSTYPPPPQYDHPEPPFYASTPQPSQPISPIEQAILDLTKLVGDAVVEQKELNAQLSKKFHTEENSLDQSLDGLNNDFEHKWDNLQDSIEDLIDQQQCPPEEDCQSDIMAEEQRVVTVQANQETETVESSLNKELDGFQSESDQKFDIQQESILKLTNQFVHPEDENLEEESQEDECLTETILVKQAQLQPQEELEVELVKAPEALQDTPVNFWPWTNEEQIRALITEESSGHETGEEPQEPIYQPIPMKLNSSTTAQPRNNLTGTAQPRNNLTATAQATKCPLPIAPSTDLVYIQPPPTENPKPATPALKAKSNPLSAMHKFKRLVAYVHKFATTSKAHAAAYTA